MDKLRDLVQALDATERKAFHAHLRSQTRATMEIKLFQLICRHDAMAPRELAARLYRPVDMNRYNSTRSRLMHKLVDFLATMRLSMDQTPVSKVRQDLMVAEFLLEKNATASARNFVQRAEDGAAAANHFDLLDQIYLFQLKHARSLGIRAGEVHRRWMENAPNYQAHVRLIAADALVVERLAEARRQGGVLNPPEIIDEALKDVDITLREANNPDFMLRVLQLARGAYLSQKNYVQLENYTARVYLRLQKVDAFGKNFRDAEIGFLYIYAHALFRNRKLEEALERLDQLEALIPQRNFKTHPLFPRLVSLRAWLLSFRGDNAGAIALAESAMDKKHLLQDKKEAVNMRLNLAVFYFQAADYKRANQRIRDLGAADAWLAEHLGREFLFKRDLILLIIHYELGHTELAASELQSLRRRYAQFLDQETYQRAGIFLRFVGQLIEHPDLMQTDAFRASVRASNLSMGEREDNQAISFFCWFRAKLTGRTYYEDVLLRIAER